MEGYCSVTYAVDVRSDEARAMTGCGEVESGPAPSQRI
jgi:hypothetical protein